MGKMKAIFMERMEDEYQGNHDAFIHGLAQASCEELIKDEEHMCPNCRYPALERNETEARCVHCAQEYIFVNSALRFK